MQTRPFPLSILILLSCFSSSAFGQDFDWKRQNPLPTGNDLLDVQFLDSQTGWAIGDAGTILKTSNGGSSWSNQNSGTIQKLNSVHFTNAQTGWAVGDSGTILKSSNGGNSWSSQNSETSERLYSVHFTNAQTGWAVGYAGTILKTSNGGSSWSSQTSGTTLSLYSIYFNDSQTGWAVGDFGTILKTTNGGSSWSNQTSGTTHNLRSMHFTDAQNGWAVGYTDHQWIYGTILKTSNGGSSWSSLNGNFFALSFVYFTDAQNGWVVDNYFGSILKTTNGGSSWTSQNSGTIQHLYSVHFTNAQTGWAVGYAGTILKTSNGGSSWSSKTSGTIQLLRSVHFTNTQTGWAVGDNGTILKTSNGGSSWSSQTSGTLRYFSSVYCTDAQTGWTVGEAGTILKTSNGGSNWSSQASGTTYWLHSVHFTDAQTGWAVGKAGTILKTSNGGSSWTTQSSGTAIELYSVHFIDAQTGWAVGGFYGTILKTSNGGSNWSSQTNGTLRYLSSVYCTDAQTGWVVGGLGTILTTITNNPIDPGTPTTLIQGAVFEKTGSDCNPANNPTPIPNRLVKALPGPYYGISKPDGKYDLRLPLGDTAQNFSLEALPFGSQSFLPTVVCPTGNTYNLSLGTIPDTLSGKDFGFEVPQCQHLEVQIASSRRRSCFRNKTTIQFVNQGSVAANDAYILVEFPHWVRPVSSTNPHIALNDSIWRFDLGNVTAGSGGRFTITDSVICGHPEILGLSQCTKATIYPAADCPPPGGWNGAAITVSGQCLDGNVSLGIYNKGIADMTDSVDYWVYLDSIQVKQAKVKLAAGDSLKLWVDANGLSVHLTANQVTNHPSEIFVSTTVDNCSDTTIFYPRPMVNRFPKQQTASSKTHCLGIRGSYDPNDKTAVPEGFTNQNIIPPNTQLEYLVRFQNSGTDTAFNVFIIDTLDQNLNVESFEMGAVSHPHQLTMQTVKSGKTFLRWQFNNILLPDSNTNELKSHGFVQYRISPKPGLALGSKVRNHAEIYFDFNPPVLTNQTLSTFDLIVFNDSTLNGNVQIVTSTAKQLEQELGVKLYPNPVTQNRLTASFSDKGSLTLYDARGAIVFRKTGIQGTETIPVSLKSGFYFASIETPMGRKSVKVVVE